MKIAIISKFPPIQGGESVNAYLFADNLAKRGHEVHVITNANEVEYNFRQILLESDISLLNRSYEKGKLYIHNIDGDKRFDHIPFSSAYFSRLLGLGIKVINEYGCDLIYGHYFEPYGLVASTLGQIFNKKVVIRNAGSDLARLATHPDLRESYKWMVSKADYFLASRKPAVQKLLLDLGAKEDKFIYKPMPKKPWYYETPPFTWNITDYKDIYDHWPESDQFSGKFKDRFAELNSKYYDSKKPTIGIYGKVSITKGSYDLLDALERISKKGIDFNFISISTGWPENAAKYYSRILNSELLAKNTWVFPGIAQWRIPSFINSCSAVCFLERDFSVAFHSPGVCREVLSVGTCLICSREIVKKQPYTNELIDKQNILIVEDPKDISELEEKILYAISDTEKAKEIGEKGKSVVDSWWATLSSEPTLSEVVETLKR